MPSNEDTGQRHTFSHDQHELNVRTRLHEIQGEDQVPFVRFVRRQTQECTFVRVLLDQPATNFRRSTLAPQAGSNGFRERCCNVRDRPAFNVDVQFVVTHPRACLDNKRCSSRPPATTSRSRQEQFAGGGCSVATNRCSRGPDVRAWWATLWTYDVAGWQSLKTGTSGNAMANYCLVASHDPPSASLRKWPHVPVRLRSALEVRLRDARPVPGRGKNVSHVQESVTFPASFMQSRRP